MEERLIYNAIKTPDGMILHSKHSHDFVTHIEAILNGGWTSEGSYYNGIFKEELKFRKDDQRN